MSAIRKKRRPATVKLNLISSKTSKLRFSVPLVASRGPSRQQNVLTPIINSRDDNSNEDFSAGDDCGDNCGDDCGDDFAMVRVKYFEQFLV